jgi:CO dehydrogenase maturation factor
MKLAIAGKGGVGKTTLAALLAQHYADAGRSVLAVDADPSPCLAAALGFPTELRVGLKPIAEMESLIYERTGAQPGTLGGFFKLNPRVDDLPERFSVEHRGVRLLELGAVTMGGSGCICPESAMLKALVTHLLLGPGDVLILDMYAGVEHMGRATADQVDAFIVVVEPGARSLATAGQIAKMAHDIGVERAYMVGNKVRGPDDEAFLAASGLGLPLLGAIPFDPALISADQTGQSVWDAAPQAAGAAQAIAANLEGLMPAGG